MQQQRRAYGADRHPRDDRHYEHPRDVGQTKEGRVARDRLRRCIGPLVDDLHVLGREPLAQPLDQRVVGFTRHASGKLELATDALVA